MLPKNFFILILFSIILTHSYSQCVDDEKSLLLQLKNELIFTSSISTKLVQWNEKDECCKWYGVECNASGYVISLQLDNESISGGIGDSSSLFRFKYLHKLNLAYNDFSYTPIPKGIHNLSYLTHLNLSHAGFGGQVPLQVSFLRRLVSLDISNEFRGINVPSLSLEYPNLEMFVQNLIGIRELYLDCVNITSSYERKKWSHIISSYLPNLTALSLPICFLSGPMSESFWQLHSLSILRLDHNDLSEVVPAMFANFSNLTTLSLSSCRLKGYFPNMIFHTPTLQYLDVSQNGLSGSIPPFTQSSHSNIIYLNLEYNSFFGNIPHSLFSLPSLVNLQLKYNQFTGLVEEFPIVNVSNIVSIDLSHNLLEGPIPDSFFQLQSLESLLLKENLFNGTLQLDKILSLPNLTKLDLSYNNLLVDSSIYGLTQLEELGLASCNLHVFPAFIKHSEISVLDLSNNQIYGEIPNWIGGRQLQSLLLANNSLSGSIPTSLCSAPNLDVVDLSDNKLSGNIPPCLLENIRNLNLARNNISGRIPDNFPLNCGLSYFNLNNNTLEGKIPKTLENCKRLSFMLVGDNKINDSFPCMLPSSLNVLVLHSNRFHGEVRCQKSWSNLLLLDISSNNFSGSLESINFSSWRAMTRLDKVISFSVRTILTIKGVDLELPNIWREFSAIDLSSNNFHGEIPNEIGDLSLHHLVNFSHNALNGRIPKSFGQLRKLESLDLSGNQLSGTIPGELAGLTFLQVLNLSYNKLVGEIPYGRQLQTFSADSFKGNPELCGFNLNISCSHLNDTENENVKEKREIEWEYVSAALGYVVGLGIIVWLLLFCRSFREKYFGKIEELVEDMFIARDMRRRRARTALRNRARRQ